MTDKYHRFQVVTLHCGFCPDAHRFVCMQVGNENGTWENVHLISSWRLQNTGYDFTEYLCIKVL